MDSFHSTDDEILKPFGDAVPNMRKVYEADGSLTDDQFARQVFSDSWFVSGAGGLAAFESKVGEPAYVYRFAYIADVQRSKVTGVSHGGEIAYVFGLTGLSKDPVIGGVVNFVSDKDKTIIAMMQNYWTNFAKTGNPNGPGLPEWNQTSPATTKTLLVDDETKTVPDFRKNQLAIIYAAWAEGTGVVVPN